jgi:hypothetical protein
VSPVLAEGKKYIMNSRKRTLQDEPLEANIAIDIPGQRVALGDGYDTGKFEVDPSPLDKAKFQTNRIPIDHYEQNFHFLRTSREVLEFLEAGASASGMLMEIEVSATANFVRSLNLSEHSVVLACKAYYDEYDEVLETAPEQLALHPAAKKILAEQGAADFIEDYGSYFVNRIMIGGRLQIVLQWNFASSSESEHFKASMEAKYGDKAKGDAHFQHTLKQVFTQEGGTLQVNKVGGGPDVPQPPLNPNDAYIQKLFDFIKRFPAQIKESPAPVGAKGMGVWKLQEIMDDRDLRSKIYELVNQTHAAVDELAGAIEAFQGQLSILTRVRPKLNPANPHEGQQVQSLAREIQANIHAIQRAWSESKFTSIPDLRELKHKGKITRLPELIAEEVTRLSPIANRLLAGATVFVLFEGGKWLAPPVDKGFGEHVVYPQAVVGGRRAAVQLEPVGKSSTELLRHGDIVRIALVDPLPNFKSRTHLAQQWGIFSLVSIDPEDRDAFWFEVRKVDMQSGTTITPDDALQLVHQSHKEAIGPKKDEEGFIGFGDNTTTKKLYLK